MYRLLVAPFIVLQSGGDYRIAEKRGDIETSENTG